MQYSFLDHEDDDHQDHQRRSLVNNRLAFLDVGLDQYSDKQRKNIVRSLGDGGEDDDDYYAGCRGRRRIQRSDLNMCTEMLGSESGDFVVADDVDGSRIMSSSSSSSVASALTVIRTTSFVLRTERLMVMRLMKDLPPMLPLLSSTLNRHGRPRFVLKKTTMSDGRVLISMDKDRCPRVVRGTSSNELSKKLVLYYNSDSDDQEDEERDGKMEEEDDREDEERDGKMEEEDDREDELGLDA